MPKSVYDQMLQNLELKGTFNPWPPYTPDEDFAKTVESFSPQDLFDKPITKPEMAAGVISGLLLLAECLDESHTISQSIAGETGSFWHGIMHRLEPDYSNAGYWFNRIGQHPALAEIKESVLKETEELYPEYNRVIQSWPTWDPQGFTRMVQAASAEGGSQVNAMRAIQLAEIRTLLDWCHREATG